MAYYLVTAKPIEHKMNELRERLDEKEITKLSPFGNTLHHSLENARRQPNGYAVWEELDYCSPPLAMERDAVLDEFFEDIEVQTVSENEGWAQIEDLPSLWNGDS